jgi:hypothetical protein
VAPNQALEPTPHSFRSCLAPAIGRGSLPALGVNTRKGTFTGNVCERDAHDYDCWVRSAVVSQFDSRLTDRLWSIKNIILLVKGWATSKQVIYRCAKGRAMPQSAEDAVAAVEQRRIDALIASDINALDEIIDEHCTHIESNGTLRTKAAFLEDVAKQEFSFDLFEIEENHIRIFGETAVVAGTYRNIVRVRGNPNAMKHARHLRVYVNRGGSWKLVAHQATEIAPRST